jgi:hypothetical protein
LTQLFDVPSDCASNFFETIPSSPSLDVSGNARIFLDGQDHHK